MGFLSFKNTPLADRINALVDTLRARYKGAASLSSATKGTEREIFVQDLLEIIFPPTIRFGTGDIVDRAGATSGQADVVVDEEPYSSPPHCWARTPILLLL